MQGLMGLMAVAAFWYTNKIYEMPIFNPLVPRIVQKIKIRKLDIALTDLLAEFAKEMADFGTVVSFRD